MPNQIPEFQISNFLTNNTVPLDVTSLPINATDRFCPICHQRYHPRPRNYVHPDIGAGIHEYPVMIQNRGACTHVFGRRCLEAHIRSGNPWSHTCPLCRQEWFPAPNRARTEILGDVEMAMNGLARVEVFDEQVRRELEFVDRALRRIREVLYGHRWI